MAKGFPYFKFIASEWLTGNIALEDYDIQGIFINICALYWHREGKITEEDITKRIKSERVNELKDKYYTVVDGFIYIAFLDEQLEDAGYISKVNSDKGKRSALKRKSNLTGKISNLDKEEVSVHVQRPHNLFPGQISFTVNDLGPEAVNQISLSLNIGADESKRLKDNFIKSDEGVNRTYKNIAEVRSHFKNYCKKNMQNQGPTTLKINRR